MVCCKLFYVFLLKYPIMKNILYAALALSIIFSSRLDAQIIKTVAGNGTSAFSGDGGAATAASISITGGVYVDASGNMYVTDQTNERVRKVDLLGNISTIAGSGTAGFSGDGGHATAARISHPSDVVVDAAGKVYFSDLNNNRIRMVSGGAITTVAGNGAGAYTGDGGPASAAALDNPCGLCMDASGKIYIATRYAIRIFNTATGIITTCAGNGTPGFSGDGGPATNAQFNGVNFFAMDAANNLYISDNGNHRIRKVSTSGTITTIAGSASGPGFSGDGGPATNAQLNNPAGAAVDASGNVYIADAINYRIRKIDASGIIRTIAGTGAASYSGDGGAATAAALDYPQDFAFDINHNLVFDDIQNFRIRSLSINSLPRFTSGASHSLIVCKDSAARAINSLLAIVDSDIAQTETWSILNAPAHGSLGSFPASSASTGGVVTPAALTYASVTGYTGSDSFVVQVTDGTDFDTIKVMVTVHDCHLGFTTINSGNEGFSIAPSPSQGSFNLFVPSVDHVPAVVVITNMVGQKIYEATITAGKNTPIQLNEPAGMYYITAFTVNGLFKSKIQIVK
jgi:sugar lactone lactonase YvrE